MKVPQRYVIRYSTVTVLCSCNFIWMAFCISMRALALTEFISVVSTGLDRMYWRDESGH